LRLEKVLGLIDSEISVLQVEKRIRTRDQIISINLPLGLIVVLIGTSRRAELQQARL
jgi:hypothetical protein